MYYLEDILEGILVSILIFSSGALSKYINDAAELFIIHGLGFLSILIIKIFTEIKVEKFTP